MGQMSARLLLSVVTGRDAQSMTMGPQALPVLCWVSGCHRTGQTLTLTLEV